MHNYTMVIYIQYKFHEIPFIGYLDMAEDRQRERWTKGRLTNIPPPLAGDKKLIAFIFYSSFGPVLDFILVQK